LFEARTPKGEAVISEIDGIVDVYWDGEQRMIKVSNSRIIRRKHDIAAGSELVVQDGDRVQEGTVLARLAEEGELLAGTDGTVFVDQQDDGSYEVVVKREETDAWEQPIPPSARLRVDKGDKVQAGEQLTEGSKNPREVLRIQGRDACQLYLMEEVQKVYRSQGVSIHDKHIEVIIRQMLRKVQIRTPGDGDALPGELMDRFAFDDMNRRIIAEGGQPARADTVLLGVTKASLNTESFLAAASFQETTRVLTDAAVRGKRDHLRGLKENVIIGKLIPVGTGFQVRQQALELQEGMELVDHDFVPDEDMGEDGTGDGDQFAEAFGLFPNLSDLSDYDDYGDD
jgi:DNA-directed RNA polymerase subunit beta'